MALTNKLSAIGDAIRGKTGKEDLLTLDQMVTEIASIETGGGGGSAMYSGSFTPAENVLTVTVDVGGEFTHFLLQACEGVWGKGAKATQLISIDTNLKYGNFIGTNNAGTAQTGAELQHRSNGRYEAPSVASYVEINSNKVTAVGATSGTVLGHFIGGITYNWYAW